LDFGIAFEERREASRIRVAGCRVAPAGQRLRLESLWCRDGEEREVIHRRAPLLPVIATEKQRHASHARGVVRAVRVAAGN
jgi:hypothetical protein